MFSEGSGSSLASTATQDGDVKQINLPDGNRLQTKGADIPPPCSPSLESKRERGSAFVCCLPGWAPAASLGCGSTLLLVASPPPRWRRRSPGRRGGGCPRRPAPTAWGGEEGVGGDAQDGLERCTPSYEGRPDYSRLWLHFIPEIIQIFWMAIVLAFRSDFALAQAFIYVPKRLDKVAEWILTVAWQHFD